MPAVITCPTCQKEYRWKPELAGKRVKCKCGEVISVPVGDPQPDPEPDDLYDLADDGSGAGPGHGIADLQAAAAPAMVDEGNQMRCPYCGESIEPGSGMCVFCGSNLQAGGKSGKRKPSSAMAAAPPVARPVKMRAPTEEEQAGKTKLIVMGVIAVAVVIGAVYGLKQFSGKSPAQDPNMNPGDARILTKIDDENGKEAREWLKNDNHNFPGMLHKQAVFKVDQFYEMGAKKVVAFGAGMSMTCVLELPDDAAKRKNIFEWQKKWANENFQKVDKDEGQKWMEVEWHL